jgi:hypothetical protein
MIRERLANLQDEGVRVVITLLVRVSLLLW